jgi:hypothetical protein
MSHWPRPARSWIWGGALVASVLLGILLGQLLQPLLGLAPFIARGGRLAASGRLAHALSKELAAEESPEAQVRIGISYRSRDGQYCRTFALREPESSAGVACREGSVWRVQVLTRMLEEHAQPGRQSVATLPVAVRQVVEAQIDGEPLDAHAEANLRRRDWRPLR